MKIIEEHNAVAMRERIKSLRKENHLSQSELGNIIGASKSVISRWESGEVRNLSIENLNKIADHFGINAAWLYGFDVPKYKDKTKEQYLIDQINVKLLQMSEQQLDTVNFFIDGFIFKDKSK